MKTTLFFSTMLFFSASAFAQTTLQNSTAVKSYSTIESDKGGGKVNSTSKASSTTDIQSNTINKDGNKSQAEVKKEMNAVASEKQTLATDTKAQGYNQMPSPDLDASTFILSGTKAKTSGKDNNLSNNASINNGVALATDQVDSKANQLKNGTKTNIKTKADAAFENSNQVKTDLNKTVMKEGKMINTTSFTGVRAAATSIHTIQVKPASLHINSVIKNNAGILIR